MIWGFIFFLVALILISGFLSGSETALFSLSAMHAKALSKEKTWGARLATKLLARPKDLLVTIILLNIGVNILIQNVTSNLFGDSSWLLNVGVPLLIVLLFGEFIPKSLGMSNNRKVVPAVAPVLFFASWLFTPVRIFFTTITQVVSRFMFPFLRHEKEISAEEMQLALKSSRQTQILGPEEADLIDGYLELEGASIKELLRPREEALFFEMQEPLERLDALFVDEECSRIPVCDKDFDHILGILTARSYFLHRSHIQTADDLMGYLQKPFYVPETLQAKSLIEQMQEREEPFAIVVDEYGASSGLISFEDLVEVVVGEIADRRDEKSLYSRSGEDVLIASGKLDLAEFEEIFGIPLESPANMVTLGGWLTEQIGDIPKAGVKYSTKDFLFHVLTADPTRIQRIYVRRL